jgi:23S rRNA pseudouridine955/2504/2580 synthase
MHLHARRLIIDHPDGDQIDVVADLPEHFANTMANLGFDPEDGAALPAAPPKPDKKAEARAHAKQYRKERRGERRGRVSGQRGKTAPPEKPRGPTKGKGSAKPASAKPKR